MSTHPGTYYRLACDQHDERVWLIDPDSEAVILHQDPDELRRLAAIRGWIVYRRADLCDDCRRELGGSPHDFVPAADMQSICAICNEWATEPRHTDAQIPGQLELPATTGQETAA